MSAREGRRLEAAPVSYLHHMAAADSPASMTTHASDAPVWVELAMALQLGDDSQNEAVAMSPEAQLIFMDSPSLVCTQVSLGTTRAPTAVPAAQVDAPWYLS